jgi:hypothetical protein
VPQQAMPACCAYEHMCLPRMRCAAHWLPRGVTGPAVHLQRPLVVAHPLHLLSSWYLLDTVSQFPHVLLPAPPCPSAVLCADHVLTTCRPTGGRSTSLPSGAAWWTPTNQPLGQHWCGVAACSAAAAAASTCRGDPGRAGAALSAVLESAGRGSRKGRLMAQACP